MNEVLIANSSAARVAEGIYAAVARLLEALFGTGLQARVFGTITGSDLAALGLILLILTVCQSAVAGWVRRISTRPGEMGWRQRVFVTVSRPGYLLMWVIGIYLAALPLFPAADSGEAPHPGLILWNRLYHAAFFAVLFWLFLRGTRLLNDWLLAAAAKSDSKLDDAFFPLIGKTVRVVVPVMAVILLLPVIGLPEEYSEVVGKMSSLLIIGMVSWVLMQTVAASEKLVLSRYDVSVADNLQARKVHTQVHVISKTIYAIISIFTVASALMLFEEVRRFGASILASAGIIGVIAGFAAQKTIANLFAGFQLALTQPIRLDDVVIVENEWGRVEEITLTYVVVRIWDERRLVVPLSYFIERPFQNWTRVSADLLGSVFIWTDYAVPVSELRAAVKQIVESCPGWDRRFWNLQVTDTTDKAVQLRVLATAADSGKAWDLRCEIREKLIHFIQKNHPESLPRFRAEWRSAPNGAVNDKDLSGSIVRTS